MRKLFHVLALLLMLGACAHAQTFKHNSPVIINPQTPGDDTLTIVGGLTAGTTPTIIVYEDGTLNTSAAIPDGSITFAKLADESCGVNDVIQWDGGAWVCGTGGGGGGTGFFDDGSVGSPSISFTLDTDTGLYRIGTDLLGFQTAGARVASINSSGKLAIGTHSASNDIHVQRVGADAALELQSSARWVLTSLTASDTLTIGRNPDATKTLYLTSTRVGIRVAPTTYNFEINGTGYVSGNWTFGGSIVSGLLPSGSRDIGSATARWANAYIDSIRDTVFTLETAQLYGGYQIIGKGVGQFAAAVAAVDTTIDFGQAMTANRWVVVRALDTSGARKTEYIKVVSLSSGTVYNVLRDRTGLHVTDPAWPINTPYLILGDQGDGRIELYANNGAPMLGMFVLTGVGSSDTGGTCSSPNCPTDQNEFARIGNMNGLGGGGSTDYGFYFGSSSTDDYVKWLSSTGTLTVRGTLNADDLAAGTLSADRIGASSITAGKLSVSTLSSIAADFGTITAGSVSGVTITGSTVQTVTNCGTSGGACAKINNTAFYLYDSSNVLLMTANGSGISLVPKTSVSAPTSPHGYAFDTVSDGLIGVYATENAGGDLRGLWLYNDTDTVGWNAYTFVGASNGTVSPAIEISADGSNGGIDIYAPDSIDLQIGSIFINNRPTYTEFSNDLRIYFDNTSSDPGLPWLRSDGNDFYVNGSPDVYINYDVTGKLVINGSVQPKTDNADTLGLYNKRYVNINLNLPNNTDPAYVVVNKGGGGSDASTALGYVAGVTGTVTVKGSDGNNCNLVFEAGVLTSETCP